MDETLIHKGKLYLDGKEYDCEIKNDVGYIDGKTAKEFMDTMTPEQLRRLALVGVAKLKNQKEGAEPRNGQLNYFYHHPEHCVEHILKPGK